MPGTDTLQRQAKVQCCGSGVCGEVLCSVTATHLWVHDDDRVCLVCCHSHEVTGQRWVATAGHHIHVQPAGYSSMDAERHAGRVLQLKPSSSKAW